MAETAEAAPAAEVQTEKVFDLAKGDFIDKPVDKEATPSKEMADLSKKAADYKAPAPTEEPPAEVKTEEKKTETPPAETPPAEVKAEEKKPDQPPQTFEPGSYIKGKWGEKYGLESEEDVEGIIEGTADVVSKYEALQKEHEALKAKSPFDSEQKEKIAKFLEPYPADKFEEGLKTAASVLGMDVPNLSARKAMEEAFVLTKPHLTREEAQEMFTERFEKDYNIDRADFDTDEAFNKKKRSVELSLKDSEAEAKKVLAAKQVELKTKPAEKPAEKVAEAKPTVTPEVIAPYQKEVEKFLNPEKNKVWDRIPYLSEDGKETLYTLVLDQEKIKDVKTFLDNFVKNPAVYSKDGKIVNFDPQELAKTALRVVHGDWMEHQLLGAAKVLAERMKAEQIASASPEKKSSGQGEGATPSIDDQFRNLAKTEADKRVKR